MPRWWIFLFALRVAWTLYGQTGYIHPDEFFQNPEVMASDILNVEGVKTWEFNQTLPIRSVILPSLTSGSAFLLLRFVQRFLGPSIINAHSLLVLPRMLITVMSGFTDIMVYKLSGVQGLLLYTTSFVTAVFFTRTLSNTLESFLFVALLYLVISDKNNQAVSSSNKALRALNEQGKTMEKKPAWKKDKRSAFKKAKPPSTLDLSLDRECEVQTTFLDIVYMSVIIALGFFNRPTFLIYAFVPYVFWAFSACGSNDHHITTHTIDRTAFSTIVATCISLIFIVCDSIYYGSLAPKNLIGIYRKLLMFDDLNSFLKTLTVTPLNFFWYNVNPDNLAQHGIHPRFLHFVGNAPCLFGILSVFAIYNVGKIIEARVGINKKLRWGTVNKTHKFLLFSYFVPLIILSVFPHQEPRFLIPLIAPLALLYGQKVFGWTAWRPWAYLWVIPNLLGALFFGVVHQGGVIPSLVHLQNSLSEAHNPDTTHIVYFHTYMPPTHLLAINKSTAEDSPSQVLVHDLKGAPIEQLHLLLEDITGDTKVGVKTVIKVISPSSLDQHFCDDRNNLSFKLVERFPWHISMEDPPTLPSDVTCEKGDVTSCNRPCTSVNLWERLETTFALFMYDVQLQNK